MIGFMKYQVVLDAESKALLDGLARPRGNNRSFVVREALRTYAAMEGYLDELEKEPRFRRMMEAALADVDAGRVRPHAAAERVVRAKIAKKR
jgi:predicted transcriptional regulator